MKTIKRIVFTGGPCSGKTTFISRAEEVFAERGYRVIIDHEAATDLISGGISPATMGMYEFQKYCIGLQLCKEDLCYKAAQNIEGDKVLIFIDRGLYDDKAYVTDEEFTELLKDFNMTDDEVNGRYDLVMNLVTAAKGAVEAYTYANNSARYETVEEAVIMDDKTQECWKNHPNRIIIGNETDFEVKMRKAIQAVFTYLGDEKPVEIFKKYLVEVDENIIEKVKKEAGSLNTHILQYYLKSPTGNERRIRKRLKGDSMAYYYSEADYINPSTRIKKDRVISERQFNDYMNEVDKDLNHIDKDRYSFFYDGHFEKLDIFDFDQTKALLSVQVPDESVEVTVPDYVKVIKDVSDDINYKNYFLAKNQTF